MTTATIDDALRQEVARWRAEGLGRSLSEATGFDACTNDYLGLAGDARLVQAARDALERFGVGARAARLLAGHAAAHEDAERAAAAWLGAERCLLLPSGYHANLAVLQTLARPGDVLLSDARNHASLIDGARLGRAEVDVFAHDDPVDLERRLRAAAHARARYIVVESVHSTDGTLAPLADYARLAETYDAWLIVDEAHAAGLYGPEGAGLAAELPRVLARTITGGKALGVAGAFVAGSDALIEALVHRGRAFVFTTAPLPAMAAALERAIDVVRSEPERRTRVHAAATMLRAALTARGVPTLGTSPIVPVPVGSPQAASACATRLQEAGFDIRALRPPTVPEGGALRIVCHADHAPADTERMATAVADAYDDLAVAAEAPVRTAQPLVIMGTDTDVGKTVVAALLVRAAHAEGKDVRYWKPVQTGADLDTDTVRRLATISDDASPAPAVQLALPASVDQAAAAEGTEVRCADLLAAAQTHLRAAPDACWLFETAGGLRVPFGPREDQGDFLRALAAPIVLVARSGLGTLNHTLLTVEALRRRGASLRALFLVGPKHVGNERTLATWLPGVPTFALPWLNQLDTAALDGWLADQPPGDRRLVGLLR